MPELRRLIVPHPLGGLKEAEIRSKVPPLVETLLTTLTDPA